MTPEKNYAKLMDMAGQAGFFVKYNEAYSPSVQEDHELTPFLKAFAALVAAAERDRILSVIGDNQCECRCAEVVRARGETK